jgi:hypothetical protein
VTPQETLIYWIKERYSILKFKEMGVPKPWSEDRVFQTTYFCNVHRENDKVTKWIRGFYAPFVDDPLFEYNIVLSRFLNSPDTLAEVGYQTQHEPDALYVKLQNRANRGEKVWGNAYVITTHGMKMAKAYYLAHDVLGAVYSNLEGLRNACRGHGVPPTCSVASKALQCVDGIGSFLAGQIVADLKNTVGHPLSKAEDRATFVEPGPGSIRGLSWFMTGHPNLFTGTYFPTNFQKVREYVDANWPEGVPPVDNQDLQNCLCEFDKYMRVKNGTGRSKRGYNGG